MAKKSIRYYTEREVRKRGKIDGRDWQWEPFFPFRKSKETAPPINQEEPTEFEEELGIAAEENIKRIQQNWSDIDEKLYRNCTNAEDRFKKAKEAFDQLDEKSKKANEDYIDAKEKFNELPSPHISQTLFWIIFTIITVAEVYFNALVFNVFGQSQKHTYIMAIGLMVAIPWLADFVGKKLRDENKSKTTIALMVVASLSVIAVLGVIATLREKFFEANKIVEKMGIRWDADSIILAFFIVNIILFVAIVILGYEAGHRDPISYKKAKQKLKDAERTLSKKSGTSKEAAEELANAQIEFNRSHSERENKFEKFKYSAEEERDKWLGFVQIYRSSNMAARRTKTKPASFNKNLEINIPASLVNIACETCCYKEERQ